MFELTTLSMFHFLRPWWLVLLVPILLLIFIVPGRTQPDSEWGGAIAKHLLTVLTVKGGDSHWFNPFNAGLFLLILSVLLMAGPTWDRQESPFIQDQAALVVALDLSNTMNQTDIQPSRLERAKQKITDLLDLRGNARTGLIAYSGSAHQVIPLSNDVEIIKQFLAAVSGNMMPKPGKKPETIIPLINQMLGDNGVPGTLLIISDGISTKTVEKFEQYFDNNRHQLLVLGAGLTEKQNAPEETAGVQQFEGAHIALQEHQLQTLAARSGGLYHRITTDKSDVAWINQSINHHFSMADDSNRPWVEGGYYLLYPIALILLFWFRKGWTLNWCMAMVFVCSISVAPPVLAEEQNGEPYSKKVMHLPLSNLFDQLKIRFINVWLTPDQQGRYYFEQGNYARAAERFRDSAWKGMAFYYAENFSVAAELFQQVDSPNGRFNLANALAQGQHYVQAVRVYSQVLQEMPNHVGAKKNRAFVQNLINEINLMSANQRAEQNRTTRDLNGAPQRADGSEQNDISYDQNEQLTADQLLTDERIYDMWMRQIQSDPARFLSAKFHLQYNQQKLKSSGK